MSKPFLKWAGGKTKLIPLIRQQLPRAKRLIEPFAGSAAVSLALDFDEYVLNDANADLINLYQILQTEKHDFVDYAQSFFTPENNREMRYYELREQFNHTAERAEKAALFVYLNRHAFNGLCRYNGKGFQKPQRAGVKFNLPFLHFVRKLCVCVVLGGCGTIRPIKDTGQKPAARTRKTADAISGCRAEEAA